MIDFVMIAFTSHQAVFYRIYSKPVQLLSLWYIYASAMPELYDWPSRMPLLDQERRSPWIVSLPFKICLIEDLINTTRVGWGTALIFTHTPLGSARRAAQCHAGDHFWYISQETSFVVFTRGPITLLVNRCNHRFVSTLRNLFAFPDCCHEFC